MGDAHGDRIAAEQALVQDLDIGALDESQFDQPALKFRRRQACGDAPRGDGMYAATKTHAGGAKCYGWFCAH